MTATTINTKTAPTAEAIQEALAFLRNLADRNPSADESKKPEPDSVFNSDVFKTIEAALKSAAEAKAEAASDDSQEEEEEETVRGKKHAAYTAEQDDTNDADDDDADDDGADEEDDDDDDDDDDDNPFAGDYYWCPGPEWKAIGLVAGGAALVGLGALLYKLLDD